MSTIDLLEGSWAALIQTQENHPSHRTKWLSQPSAGKNRVTKSKGHHVSSGRVGFPPLKPRPTSSG